MVRTPFNPDPAHVRRMVQESADRWWHRRPGETAAREARKEQTMPSFNQVNLLGNVTRDPQIKHLANNQVVAEFGLAMNRKYRTAAGEDREDVCFVDCTAFGKGAEVIGQYVSKGKPLFVSGRLKLDQWEDRNGGGKRSKLSVVVDNFQLLGGRDSGGGNDEPDDTPAHRITSGQSSGYRTRASEAAKQRPDRSAEQPFGEEKQFEEADIPF